MAKKIRNLLNEIDKKFKESDEVSYSFKLKQSSYLIFNWLTTSLHSFNLSYAKYTSWSKLDIEWMCWFNDVGSNYLHFIIYLLLAWLVNQLLSRSICCIKLIKLVWLNNFCWIQGIQIIDNLQSKLENAPSQNMKEKFETEMKKEIKKLQRLRDFFRTNQNNADIKDKSKLDQGRKMIENVSYHLL